MSIYIITHKKVELPKGKDYKFLLVGANKGHIFGDCYDDTGDNISEKNKNYCELTGLYWIWKNIFDEYIGLVHYRRFFFESFNKKKILSFEHAKRFLNHYDMILPFHCNLKSTVKEQYCEKSGFEKDLILVREIIHSRCPEYIEDYDQVMNQNFVYFSNMMITRKKILDDYCQWLFGILGDLEKKVDVSSYNAYQKRIFGFLSERLLTVYVKHNNFKVCELGIANTEEKLSLVQYCLTGLRRKVNFCIKLLRTVK